ncbi:TetR family transcriptional regulator [Aeromicrobium sp. 636]|uniref:TetR/AcrR family transcriptional regulator n=1 Tax=Aeromicrobium senzhongii TaxID=2663859 RepID=A0A8I0K1L5_9ACTN|nr:MULTISPECIES: TetR/AcrR family transcriptional regulator [Aeromicrobium]MBC9227018.1 TetR/AcrR family transcriptional regulator [Aeromicrobium senzhongii]MCQ3999118.1 TetR family transcriptional regulator [Aeromicrobium sp. 636]MTB89380.1 TetR family transcriptional regulator [Aeromicrobium senzhongii]QNL94471.1 TetR/AcrR family transcriptional regulator [Aeromicrobium senzhongii]
MAEERSTRDRVLDAFERLLVSTGSRAATLDAVAAEAGVSKGGLLYHFHSREALVDGMVERLREQARADVAKMLSAPQGPVEFYLETSVDSGSDFDRALIAASRIAQENDAGARTALAEIREAWFDVLNEHLGDVALARTIQLIGDGLYFDDTTGLAHPDALTHVREVLKRLP